jgi:hypothetical protein
MLILHIGGPADGEWKDVSQCVDTNNIIVQEEQPLGRFGAAIPSSYKIARYRRLDLQYQGRKYDVMVFDDGPEICIVQALIQGYNPQKKEK